MIALVLTVGAGFIARYFLAHGGCDDAALRSAASAYASVTVTMLGFMMAMLAILVTVSDRRLIRNMVRTGHYDRLLHKMYLATIYFGVAMLASLASLFMDGEFLVMGMSIASGLVVGASYLAVEVGIRLRRILTLVNPPLSSPLE